MPIEEIRAGAWEAASAAAENYDLARRPVDPFDLIEDFGSWVESVEMMAGAVAVVVMAGAILGEEWSVGEEWEV